ncbi:hypothetical protein PAV_6c01020 [Paenibacillus alvei DSM 29]|nr:hypothetical protein PAV_6c01020 [Paenibacillus alvei DSM 29]
MEIHRKYKFMQYFLYSKDLSREEIMQKGKILVMRDNSSATEHFGIRYRQ